MLKEVTDLSLTLCGFNAPGNLRQHQANPNPDDLQFVPEPDMSIQVEHGTHENLRDCIGLLVWEGVGVDAYLSGRYLRVALSLEDALVLGKKLQALAEIAAYKEAVK